MEQTSPTSRAALSVCSYGPSFPDACLQSNKCTSGSNDCSQGNPILLKELRATQSSGGVPPAQKSATDWAGTHVVYAEATGGVAPCWQDIHPSTIRLHDPCGAKPTQILIEVAYGGHAHGVYAQYIQSWMISESLA